MARRKPAATPPEAVAVTEGVAEAKSKDINILFFTHIYSKMEDGGLIMTTKADNAREAPMIDQIMLRCQYASHCATVK